jgi:class 3 adenylate cyclase
MRSLMQFSIKSKLIAMLLVVSSSSILVTAYIGYQSGESNLTSRVFKQLTSVRASKAYQIESYFKTLRNHIQTLSENPTAIEAMQKFDVNYRSLEIAKPKAVEPVDIEKKLRSYYQNQFLPRLSKAEQGSPVLDFFKPKNLASRYLQYHYIAANPNPVGKKHLLNKPKDGSSYSETHAKYHPIFRSIIEKFGYYDLFLINPEGKIVYTVYKETDFTTDLKQGAYNESNLAKLVSQVRQEKQKDYARIIDFESYAPSYGAPAAFIATPIFNGSEFIGVLAVQIPVNEVNNVMTGNRNWESDGLGKTGETYLVGSDRAMRSVSRFLVEKPKEYLETLRSLGVSEKTLKRIEQYETSILEQKVETDVAKAALAGKKGTQIIQDYRNISVLSSYAPLNIEELDWAIVSEIDLAEAYEPIYAFERQLLISATVLMLIVTLLAMGLAYLFVKPIEQLIASARKVETGDLEAIAQLDAQLKSEDEFGELAKSFNGIVNRLRTQTDLVEAKNIENEQLLLSIFPAAIAKRLKRGEKNIAEGVSNVAVLYAELMGFGKLSASLNDREIVGVLNDLVSSFDEVSERYGMEKIKTIGDRYMAVCGLSLPYLDHDKRAIDFALEMLIIVRRFNHERGLQSNVQLSIRIGISSGEVVTGIVGKQRSVYDVWGETVNIANALMIACPIGAILVSPNVYRRLEDLYDFESIGGMAESNGKANLIPLGMTAWCLKSIQQPARSDIY